VRDRKLSESHPNKYGTLIDLKFSNATEGLRILSFSKLMAFQEQLASGVAFESNIFLNHQTPFHSQVCIIIKEQVKQLKENTKIIKHWKRS